MPSAPSLRRVFLSKVLGGVCALGLGLTQVACSKKGEQFVGIDITGADYALDFLLTDHLGRSRGMKDFRGKVVVVFFGFTQCPDVCPAAMAELAEVRKQLGKDGERLQGLFVTLDPERDSPDVLRAYMANFDASFLALRPQPQQLSEVARSFKVYYKKVEGKTASSYTLDHTARSYVYDTQGRVRLITRHGTGPAGLLSDVKILLAQAA